MGRKQESGFGVVARTGVSLLALGFGSALFGALVVGPSLGKQLSRDNPRELKLPPAGTRVASAKAEASDRHREERTREPEARAHEPEPAEEPKVEAEPKPAAREDPSQFVEGTGAEAVVPSAAAVAADSQEPDRSHDEQASTDPVAPRAAVEPLREVERPRRSERAPVEEPRVRERKRDVEPRAEKPALERPRRSTREAERRETREAEAATERREARRESDRDRRDREEVRSAASDRRTEAKKRDERDDRSDREDRKSTRTRTPEPPRTRLTETKSEGGSSKRGEPVKISAARRPEPATPVAEPAEPPVDSKLFRVRVGSVQPREEAERLRDEIKGAAGVDAFLVRIGEGFQVQTGAYRQKANAEKIAAELRSGNFRPRVTEDK
ncbi:MAG: hypothetical protein K0Q72_1245 [Armatimonadetes bacterium]|jgi:hypothetical protein|nr:hypothetical protein [Armatimonadota bacterium]